MSSTILVNGISFEPESGRLARGQTDQILRPKTAAVLSHLVGRRGEVVTKDELLRHVWPNGYVTEAALAVCINELRRAFDDCPGKARVIATVHGRGYRMVAEVSSGAGAGLFVGRTRELGLLRGWLEQADGGRRTVGFVAGPGGIGKSALLETFAGTSALAPHTLVGWGQCTEDLQDGEPYRPLLDALAGLCRGEDGDEVRAVLARWAPSWLLRLPALLDDCELEALFARAGAAAGDRMLRELADALGVLAAKRTVVLALEDLHACDGATAELVRYLAARREPARLLVVGTYRPAEAIAGHRAIRRVVQDLRARRRCEHLSLEPLSRSDVGAYLSRCLAPRTPSPTLVAGLWERTDGHALSMVAMTDFLVERGLLDEGPEGVSTSKPLAQLGLPHEVRQMLEQSIGLLDGTDQRLLEVAAAIGLEFSVETLHACVGGWLEVSRFEVEERCARIAREHPALTAEEERNWPDGGTGAGFRFTHAMYRDLVQERLGPQRRALVERALAGDLARLLVMEPHQTRPSLRPPSHAEPLEAARSA